MSVLVTQLILLISISPISAAISPVSVVHIFPSEDYNSFRPPAYITARFSGPLEESTANSATFVVKDSLGNKVVGSVTMDLRNGSHDATFTKFTPDSQLRANQTYTVKLDGFKDASGKKISPYQWSFTIMDDSKVQVSDDHPQSLPPPVTAAPPDSFNEDTNGRDHRNLSLCDNLASVPIERDTDGDKIPDFWEICGIDVNRDGQIDLDLKALGANPSRKDVFVEIDYMENHKPNDQAIRDVIASFGRANVYSNRIVTEDNQNSEQELGVGLHVIVDDEIPHQNSFKWSDRDKIKGQYFGTALDRQSDNGKNIIAAKGIFYHYAIFVHSQQGTSSSGKGEIRGNDFIVSLGSDIWGKDRSGHHVGSLDQQSGTFMHELGHNLGLLHGGSDDVNNKPNYVSVMNYVFQMPSLISDRPLDFSRCKSEILFEDSLSEKNGIRFKCPRQEIGTTYIKSLKQSLLSDAAVDYNEDGDIIDTRVVKDLNNDNQPSRYVSASDSSSWSLTGNNDWSKIKFYLWYTPSWYYLNKWNTKSIFSGVEPSISLGDPEYSGQDLFNDRLLLLEGIESKLEEISNNSESGDPTTFRLNDSSYGPFASSIADISKMLKTNDLDSAIGELRSLNRQVGESMSLTSGPNTNLQLSEPIKKSKQDLDSLINNFIEVLKKQK